MHSNDDSYHVSHEVVNGYTVDSTWLAKGDNRRVLPFTPAAVGALVDEVAALRADLEIAHTACTEAERDMAETIAALRAERDHYEGVVTSIVNALELPTGADVVAEVERMRAAETLVKRLEEIGVTARAGINDTEFKAAWDAFRAAQQETTDA